MKTIILFICVLLVRLVHAQTFSDKIVRELQFEKPGNNTLILANINGSIKVEGYDGNKILIEVNRTIKAKTESRLELGKKEVSLNQIDRADTLVVYVKDGCNEFSFNKKLGNRRGWNYQWRSCEKDCHVTYDYTANFSVKIPYNTQLEVSTINEGDITVENVSGKVIANNINGSIKLTALKSATRASTINGNVDLEYAGNPTEDCRYYTLNGDINAWFKKGLAANISFKSFNGELFSNVEQLESLPAVLKKDDLGKIRLNGNRYKISKGGALLDFETFNGDVYVREK